MPDNGQSKEPKFPKCPGCGKQPLDFVHGNQVIGSGAVISIIWCQDCGHVFSMSQIAQQAPAIVRPDLRVVKGN